MLSFQNFVQEKIAKGELINTLFEERLFALVGTLESIAAPLNAAHIPYALIGGGAVMLHVNSVDPSAVRNTKDVDIMVNRDDLEAIRKVAEQCGFKFRHVAGVDMLLPPGQSTARNAIHLVFAGERVKSSQSVPNPPVRPEYRSIHEVEVAVITVSDLVRMKLSNNRDIDRVHVRDLDSVGLITVEVERALPPTLKESLDQIRNTD